MAFTQIIVLERTLQKPCDVILDQETCILVRQVSLISSDESIETDITALQLAFKVIWIIVELDGGDNNRLGQLQANLLHFPATTFVRYSSSAASTADLINSICRYHQYSVESTPAQLQSTESKCDEVTEQALPTIQEVFLCALPCVHELTAAAILSTLSLNDLFT
jgi:hypothetical protein